ncbi:MAG: CRISPR-associated endonuclease Cas2 [Acidobacteriota bacterium]
MRHIIAYDIEDDAVRSRVATVLEGYGQRVQLSVFECDLDEKSVRALVDALTSTLGEQDAGNIRLYRTCADCYAASIGLGRIARTTDSQACTII